jgi:hypothetical protein
VVIANTRLGFNPGTNAPDPYIMAGLFQMRHHAHAWFELHVQSNLWTRFIATRPELD